jgi:hypothetical protein
VMNIVPVIGPTLDPRGSDGHVVRSCIRHGR